MRRLQHQKRGGAREIVRDAAQQWGVAEEGVNQSMDSETAQEAAVDPLRASNDALFPFAALLTHDPRITYNFGRSSRPLLRRDATMLKPGWSAAPKEDAKR